MKGGCTHSAQGGVWHPSLKVGVCLSVGRWGRSSRRFEGSDPPSPPSKKRQGCPNPTTRPGERDPPPRYPLGYPPVSFSALVYVGETISSFIQIGLIPPTPYCFEPVMGTPCHHFCGWDPPTPPGKKGEGSPRPHPTGQEAIPPPKGTLVAPPPFSGCVFISETCLHPVPSGVFRGGCTCQAGRA